MGRWRAGVLLCAALALGAAVVPMPLVSALDWCDRLSIWWWYPGLAYAGQELNFSLTLSNGLAEPLEVSSMMVKFGWEASARDWGGMDIKSLGSGTQTHPITPPAVGGYPVDISVTGQISGGTPEVCGTPPFTRNLTVFPLPLPPEVAITASPAIGPAPLTVAFTAEVTEGLRPLTYAWTFGDGNGSVQSSPSHTYALPGEYRVSVVVTDRRARSVQDNMTIAVQDILVGLQPQGSGRGLILPLAVGVPAVAASLVAAVVVLRRRRRVPPGPPVG